MARPKKLPQIEVRTIKGGYTLKIQGHRQEYMYFTPEKLMEGVIVHVGLKMTEQLDPALIKSFIDSALEWNNLKASHKEVQKLQRELKQANKKHLTVAKRLMEERHRMLRLCRLAKDCVTGHSSLTDALAKLHARAKQDGALRELTLKDFGITSDQIIEDDE